MTEPASEPASEPAAVPAALPPTVRVLEDRLINQIAAGEVVERPASVVKELVENALDAGAHHLRLTLRGGGRDLIQVEDDGVGMGRQDAMLCVERHATSKLRSEKDLFAITTLGFRGEALPSIAAVSRFELTTRRASDRVGTRVVIDGGRMVDVRDAGCPAGTRLVVRSLFYNLPARRKFLRTERTESGHCHDTILSEVLTRPDVGIELFSDGRALIRSPASTDPTARAVALLGRDAEQLLPVSFTNEDLAGGLRATGLVSPPGVHRASARGSLWLYVNGRSVRDPLLRRAVLDAVRGLVPRGRYPLAILDVAVPPQRVDVNVHPAKSEVRFRDGRDVLRAVSEGLRTALASHGIHAHTLHAPRGVQRVPDAVPDSQAALPGLLPPAPSPPAPSPPAPSPSAPSPAPPPAPPPDSAPDLAATPQLARADSAPARLGAGPDASTRLRLVGQLGQRWLVCEHGQDLVLVDQRRAHAAAIRRGLAADPKPRPLLAPTLVELSPAACQRVASRSDLLSEIGVELESFGQGTLSLRALPAALRNADPVALVQHLGAALSPGATVDSLRRLLAAQAAVPLGQHLSPYEQRGLVDGLDLDQAGSYVRLDAAELERRLGRQGS
ncbi:MAG: DNA mismatch repair endonuclease MutL [Oligoflexia bacterium]|nr:DNA mismatch repair endonuclease MutL [Oligoflexia bacterium]